MRLLPLALLLAACPPSPSPDMAVPGDGGPNGNPAQLWLALDGSELHVKLVPSEPPPF